ncbi:zinc finger protein 629-like [Cyclopterus lumpus]|uniref:zinc finger protein 629-like n=1 Tax=Cyclopterus lumpus TaxID=8103 RepID=UPI0014861930|nr:zinc finger protein 629-like [Cyclopterus lumpus]
MSFGGSFATQIAAIMDALAKAAVAEITQLVEDGGVVLRLEMCRKDGEIQELRRSLTRMEVQLCNAREEAAASRAAEEEEEEEEENRGRAAAGRRVLREDEMEDPKSCTGQLVKHEPADELAAQETADDAVTADICFQAAERGDLSWPPPACCMFEKSSVAMQPHIQMFPAQAERYAAHGDRESSGDSLSTAAKDIDPLRVPIKVEVDVRPMCMRSAPSEPVHNQRVGHASHAAASQDRCSQPAGPSLAPPPAQRSTVTAFGLNAEDPVPNRSSNPRAKKVPNAWKANQKLFVCSVCNRGFPRLHQLEEHRASHRLFKPFRCLECGKSFTQKTRLKTHQSVHTGERPFSCKICGKMFSRQDNCLRHERFHDGLKPYVCGQCGKSFTVLGNLKIHQEIHLQGR